LNPSRGLHPSRFSKPVTFGLAKPFRRGARHSARQSAAEKLHREPAAAGELRAGGENATRGATHREAGRPRDRCSPGEPPRLRPGGDALATDHRPVSGDRLVWSCEHADAELCRSVDVPGGDGRREVARCPRRLEHPPRHNGARGQDEHGRERETGEQGRKPSDQAVAESTLRPANEQCGPYRTMLTVDSEVDLPCPDLSTRPVAQRRSDVLQRLRPGGCDQLRLGNVAGGRRPLSAADLRRQRRGSRGARRVC
jgi:hypothetical protein